MFVNPNDTAKVPVCPTVSRATGTPLTCTVTSRLDHAPALCSGRARQHQSGTLPAAWNAIASAGGSALTILEWQ